MTSPPRNVATSASRAAAQALISCIQLYRHMVSPLRLPTCRFMPTCSQYAVDALSAYGVIRGSWLAALRLAKCGPWHRGGWDPVPERRGCAHDCDGDEGDEGDEGDVSGTSAKRRESASFV